MVGSGGRLTTTPLPPAAYTFTPVATELHTLSGLSFAFGLLFGGHHVTREANHRSPVSRAGFLVLRGPLRPGRRDRSLGRGVRDRVRGCETRRSSYPRSLLVGRGGRTRPILRRNRLKHPCPVIICVC